VDEELRTTSVLDRSPPADERAERALLGGLLIDPEAIVTIAPFLEPSHFYRARHGRIYEAIASLYERRQPTDFVSVAAELESAGQLELVGGTAYLTQLINAVPTSLHAEAYARIIERCGLMRRLIGAANEIASIGYENPPDVDAALDRAEQALFEVSQRRVHQDFVSLRRGLQEFFDQIEQLQEQRGELIGVPSGFADLDKLTGGLHEADLIIVAARPSVGKSAFAFNLARNAAVLGGAGVAIFSLEMSIEQIVQRMLCSEAAVDSQRLRQGYIDEHEWRRISEAFGVLSEAPIWFDDTPAISTTELRMKARRLKAEHDIKLVIVDYIQLMQGRGLENRVQEVSEISRSLKALARELRVPVIALSQLSRAIEARQDHRPVLSDLRESGSIEQDADIVIFIHREELYNPNTDRRNIADLIVAKHRNGPTASIPLRFFPGQIKFVDLEIYRQPE
jgi:replicative DNA helicase